MMIKSYSKKQNINKLATFTLCFLIFCFYRKYKFGSIILPLGIDYHEYYLHNKALWNDYILDLYFPFAASILFLSTLYMIYEKNIYEMVVYLNKGKYNKKFLKIFLLYFFVYCILINLYICVFYSAYIKSGIAYLRLIFRFIPPTLFYLSIGFFIITFTKNIVASLAFLSIYMFTEIFSQGRMLKLFTTLASSYNLITIDSYIKNRIILLSLSLIFLLLGLLKSSKY